MPGIPWSYTHTFTIYIVHERINDDKNNNNNSTAPSLRLEAALPGSGRIKRTKKNGMCCVLWYTDNMNINSQSLYLQDFQIVSQKNVKKKTNNDTMINRTVCNSSTNSRAAWSTFDDYSCATKIHPGSLYFILFFIRTRKYQRRRRSFFFLFFFVKSISIYYL